MNLNIIKEILQSLFPDKKSGIIALLLVVIACFMINNLVSTNREEVETEIMVVEDEIQEKTIELTKIQKDIKTNQVQVDALWVRLGRLERKLDSHKEAKRH